MIMLRVILKAMTWIDVRYFTFCFFLSASMSDRFAMIEKSGHLLIRNLSKDDNGSGFRCLLEDTLNGHIFMSKPGFLTVSGKLIRTEAQSGISWLNQSLTRGN